MVGFGFGQPTLGFGILARFTFGSIATGTSAVLRLKARLAVTGRAAARVKLDLTWSLGVVKVLDLCEVGMSQAFVIKLEDLLWASEIGVAVYQHFGAVGGDQLVVFSLEWRSRRDG